MKLAFTTTRDLHDVLRAQGVPEQDLRAATGLIARHNGLKVSALRPGVVLQFPDAITLHDRQVALRTVVGDVDSRAHRERPAGPAGRPLGVLGKFAFDGTHGTDPTEATRSSRRSQRSEALQFTGVRLDGSGQTPLLNLELPADVRSVLVEIQGQEPNFYLVDRLVAADGKQLVRPSTADERDVDVGPLASPLRSQGLVVGSGSFLATSTGEHALGAGTYRLGVVGHGWDDKGTIPASGEVDIKVHIQRGPPPRQGKLNLQLHLPALHGWKADSAEREPFLQKLLAATRENLAQAGLDLDQLSFRDLPARFAEVADQPMPGEVSPEELFRQSAAEGALGVFLLHNLHIAGAAAGGFSGGIPGPLSAGTSGSGVAVAIDDPAHRDPADIGRALAHEIGHYLGLSHTSERDGKLHDTIADTPEGPAGSDNLMYFRPLRGEIQVSGEQQRVLHTHPLVH